MQKILLFFALLLAYSQSNPCQGQQYYWSQGRRIQLKQVGPFRYVPEDDTVSIVPNGYVVLRPKGETTIEQLLEMFPARLLQEEADSAHPVALGNFYRLIVKEKKDLFEVANAIYESGKVDFCHPDFWVRIQSASTPTDPYYAQQYYLHNTSQANCATCEYGVDCNAEEAWDITKGVNVTRVAVLDKGIPTHSDLPTRVEGFPQLDNPITGYSIPGSGGMPEGTSTDAHGIAAAGLIAAAHNNIAIAGLSPCSEIVPVNIYAAYHGDLGPYGWPTKPNEAYNAVSNLSECFAYAADSRPGPSFLHGRADVIVCPWDISTSRPNLNNPNPTPTQPKVFDILDDAIVAARTTGRKDANGVARGCLVLFAAGNYLEDKNRSSSKPVFYPASNAGVLAVGACSARDSKESLYSSVGPEIGIVAVSTEGVYQPNPSVPAPAPPYADVVSLGFSNSVVSDFRGTSAAVPQVGGAAALMLSVNPNLTESQVRTLLQQTATDVVDNAASSLYPVGKDDRTGYGRLNVAAAIRAAAPISGPGTISWSNSVYSVPLQPTGTTITWSFTVDGQPFPSCNTNPNAYPNKMTGQTLVFQDPHPCILNQYQTTGIVTATLTGTCGTAVLTREVILPGLPAPQRQAITTYPNPANESLHLNLASIEAPSAEQSSTCDVTLYDIYGRTKKVFKGLASSADMPVADLPDGIYVMRIASDKSYTVKQIEVKH